MKPVEIEKTIEACKSHNAAAQERLYRHYFALMFSICKPFTHDEASTLSLINEGFLKIFSSIRKFDNRKGNFESWAKTIMTHTCIDFSRKQKAEGLFVDLDEEIEEGHADYHQHDGFAQEQVHFLVKRLPQLTQKVFSLYTFDGYSYKEISEMLNMAESTSRWHVGEARKNLKEQLNKIL